MEGAEAGTGLRRWGAVAIALTLATALAACSDDGSAEEAEEADRAQHGAFCAEAADFEEEVPEAYVGSADHVADLRRLATSAPASIRSDVDRLARHFEEDVSPDEPDSQLIENFSGDVIAAIDRVTTFIDDHCES